MRELASSILFSFPENPEQVDTFLMSLKEEILSGIIDPKRLIIQKKIISDTLDALMNDIDVKRYLAEEIEKYGKEGAGYGSFKITKEQRRTYDYSQTGDSLILKFQDEAERYNQQLKGRQKFLQMLSKPMADPETGELIYPAAVSVSEFFKVSQLKK